MTLSKFILHDKLSVAHNFWSENANKYTGNVSVNRFSIHRNAYKHPYIIRGAIVPYKSSVIIKFWINSISTLSTALVAAVIFCLLAVVFLHSIIVDASDPFVLLTLFIPMIVFIIPLRLYEYELALTEELFEKVLKANRIEGVEF